MKEENQKRLNQRRKNGADDTEIQKVPMTGKADALFNDNVTLVNLLVSDLNNYHRISCVSSERIEEQGVLLYAVSL